MDIKYYKIVVNSAFVGVGSTHDLRYYQSKHNSILACYENLAEYVQIGNNFYRDKWMALPKNKTIEYIDATITRINKDEYDALSSAKDVEELIAPEPPEETTAPTEPDEYVEYVKSMKIKELSLACNQTIVSGFNYDNKHYSLSIEDQLELQSLMFQINVAQNPDTKYLYHADNSEYEEMTQEQILDLYNAANSWKNSQRLYFNQLKQYVLGLSTMEEISSVYYGMEIPI